MFEKMKKKTRRKITETWMKIYFVGMEAISDRFMTSILIKTNTKGDGNVGEEREGKRESREREGVTKLINELWIIKFREKTTSKSESWQGDTVALSLLALTCFFLLIALEHACVCACLLCLHFNYLGVWALLFLSSLSPSPSPISFHSLPFFPFQFPFSFFLLFLGFGCVCVSVNVWMEAIA